MTGSKLFYWSIVIIWILAALLDLVILTIETTLHNFTDFGSSVLIVILFTAIARGRLVDVGKEDTTP